jgi:hypothetical protein
MDKFKTFSFIIAIKRYKKNSILPNIPKYLVAKELNMSVNTYSKLLNQAINQGLITKQNDHYKVVSFRTAIQIIFQETGFFFAKRRILRSENTNYKQIHSEILEYAVIDNIIRPQQRIIQNKKYFSLLEKISNSNGTDKKSFSEWYRLPRAKRKRIVKEYKKCVQNNVKSIAEVVTSCRHTAQKLNLTKYMANKTLNSKAFNRKVIVNWVKGVSFVKLEQLRIQYPNATIIPCMKINAIKVCHGSEVSVMTISVSEN